MQTYQGIFEEIIDRWLGCNSKIESSLISTRLDSAPKRGSSQEFVRIILADGTFAGLSEELEGFGVICNLVVVFSSKIFHNVRILRVNAKINIRKVADTNASLSIPSNNFSPHTAHIFIQHAESVDRGQPDIYNNFLPLEFR